MYRLPLELTRLVVHEYHGLIGGCWGTEILLMVFSVANESYLQHNYDVGEYDLGILPYERECPPPKKLTWQVCPLNPLLGHQGDLVSLSAFGR